MDEEGPHDLHENDVLWRRVRRSEVTFDENDQRSRPTSQAFQNYKGTDSMSVFVPRLINFSHDPVLGPSKDDLIVEFSVKLAHECGQEVVPALEEGPGHYHVVGKKTGTVRSRFATECTWVKPPKEFDARAGR
jgi:hypothetical protein